MNLGVLKTFCDLVDSASFSKAAEINLISQSAVSQQVARLERELGTQLVSRGRGLVAPTEAGKAFYRGARDILRRYESLVGEVRSAADMIRGVLRVGTIYSVGMYCLDPYVKRFIQAHPEVTVRVEYMRAHSIYAAVANAEMALGVVAYPERHRAIEIIPFITEQLVAVFGVEHPLARRRTIDATELEGEDFVAFEPDVPTRRHIDRRLKAEKVAVNVTMAFDNNETLKRAVEIGVGVTILPRSVIDREVAAGSLAFAEFRNSRKWVRPLGILRTRGRASTPAESKFLAMLKTPD
ncbi:MAG TPA: LysR family transcriptional regulator [Phycisphaerae bacterium]|nr:LysR family transcriptional regulator [Phycisphaerae bacterium]